LARDIVAQQQLPDHHVPHCCLIVSNLSAIAAARRSTSYRCLASRIALSASAEAAIHVRRVLRSYCGQQKGYGGLVLLSLAVTCTAGLEQSTRACGCYASTSMLSCTSYKH
jgi:hypothetical protein